MGKYRVSIKINYQHNNEKKNINLIHIFYIFNNILNELSHEGLVSFFLKGRDGGPIKLLDNLSSTQTVPGEPC